MDCSIASFLPPLTYVCNAYLDFSKSSFLHEYGIFGLFINALLGASALPIPTEPLVSTLLSGGQNQYLIITTLIFGGSLGGIMNYGIGFGGNKFLNKLKDKKETEDHKKSHRLLDKFGWLVIFGSAWIPVIGDLLLISAGAKKMHFNKFVVLMIAGKSLRAIVVVFTIGLIF